MLEGSSVHKLGDHSWLLSEVSACSDGDMAFVRLLIWQPLEHHEGKRLHELTLWYNEWLTVREKVDAAFASLFAKAEPEQAALIEE